MNNRYKNRFAITALALVLSAGTVVPVFADDGGAAAQADTVIPVASIGSVSMSPKSYIELKQAALMPGEDGNTAVFTITLTNGDDSELRFIDYWVRLLNKDGTSFSVSLLPQDKDKNVVPAHSSMDVSFYAKVNASTSLTDLVFKMIKWDFSVPGYERTLGTISVPGDYTLDTPAGASRLIPLGGTALKTSVKKVTIGKNADSYLANIHVEIQNAGLKSVAAPGLAYSLITSEGLVYPLTVAGAGAAATDQPPAGGGAIAPRVKKEVQLSGEIPNSVDPNGWKLAITNKVDDKIGYVPLAYFLLPAPSKDDDTTAPINEKRPVDIGGVTVQTGITRVSVSKNDQNYMTNVFFAFENAGSSAVGVKGYQYELVTKDGLTYPLAIDTAEFTLNPKASKEVQLSVSIPLSVNIEGMKLSIKTGSGSSAYPVASYSVPKATTNDVSLGIEYPYNSKSGAYTAKLTSVQRLPWEDQDILAAEVQIGNKGGSSLPLPNLQGYFLLDGGVKVDAVLTKLDNVISVQGRSTVDYMLYAKIPYSSSFGDLKLIVQDKVDDKSSNNVAEFKHNADLLQIPVVAKGETRKLNDTGKSAELKIDRVQSYSGADTDLFYAELEMKNTEKRAAAAGRLTGYWKTQDDMYYPATLSTLTGKIAPNGKALVGVWSKVPKGLKMADMSLVLGEAMTAGGSDASVDAYVKAFGMQLPDEITGVQSSLNNVKIGDYTINISGLKAEMDYSNAKKFNLSFNYTLAKGTELSPEFTAEQQHKLIMEVNDSTQKYEQKFTLGGDTGLSVGTSSGSMSGTATDFVANRWNQSQNYTLNLYDEFNGHRRLVATISRGWFAVDN